MGGTNPSDDDGRTERRPIPPYGPGEKPDHGPLAGSPDDGGTAYGGEAPMAPFDGDVPADPPDLSVERARAVLDAALDDDRVADRLDGHRFEPVGLVSRDRKGEPGEGDVGEGTESLGLVVYDYTEDAAVEVSVTPDGTDVVGLSERDGPVPLGPAEVDRAVDLLVEAGRVDEDRRGRAVTDAFAVTAGDPAHPRVAHRGAVVSVDARAGRRLSEGVRATHRAEVDLSTDEVLTVRPVEGPGGGRSGPSRTGDRDRRVPGDGEGNAGGDPDE
ncbi:hypothetical protein [Halobaculum sp. EA56]|uniref:hypothetical protein n=1 Tax=Halobaculum sp. EA56 TaxID=3421648 RepID=UPI003EC1541A